MYEVQELLSDNLKRIRRRLGLSQLDLSNLSGISTSYIGDIETGRKFPSARILQLLVNTLHVAPEELFRDSSLLAAESRSNSSMYRAELLHLRNRLQTVVDEMIERHEEDGSNP